MARRVQARSPRGRAHRVRISWPAVVAGGAIVLLAAALAAASLGAGRSGADGPTIPVTVQGAPSLQVDRRDVDLGRVPLGRTVDVSFQIGNAGDQPLVISQVPYIDVVKGC